MLSSGAVQHERTRPLSPKVTTSLSQWQHYFLTPCPLSPFPPPLLLPSGFLPPLPPCSLPQQTCVLPTSLFGAVRRLSFSPDGKMLCGIGADRDNSLCVWSSASGDWADGARVALGQGPRRAAMFVAWSAGGGSESSSPYQVQQTHLPAVPTCPHGENSQTCPPRASNSRDRTEQNRTKQK